MAVDFVRPSFPFFPRSASGSGRTSDNDLYMYMSLATGCLAMARRRAALAGLSSLVPMPGLGLAIDVALLMSIIEEINRRYGLSARQVEALAPNRKAVVFQMAKSAGGFFATRIAASQTFALILSRAGLRLGIAEAARFAPVIGQIAAALIAYFTLIRLAKKHIAQCASIVQEINTA